MVVNMKVLVTGATGRQGEAVARRMRMRGHAVRVLTRRPERARELARMGAEVFRGDFDDRESLMDAVEGMDAMFLMGTPFEKGPRAEVRQGEAAIVAAWNAGLGHVVYSSVFGADRKTGIPHFDSKAEVESALKEADVPYTILRPTWFMENFESPWLLPHIRQGVLSLPLRRERVLQMVSVEDIGGFATEAFTRPEAFVGKEIGLAGDEMTMADIVSYIAYVRDAPLRYEQMPADRVEQSVGEDFARMYRWLDTTRDRVDIKASRGRWPVPTTSFGEFLARSPLCRRKAA